VGGERCEDLPEGSQVSSQTVILTNICREYES
jgi:hypothetical protein